MDLDFAGNFDTEKGKLDEIKSTVDGGMTAINSLLDTLNSAWVDKDSAEYITEWRNSCEEVKSQVNTMVSNAKEGLDSIASILNS